MGKPRNYKTGKTTREKAQEERFIRVEGKPIWKRATGHQGKVGGAGVHADKRSKRARTRGAAFRKALGDQN